ncbi:hypothetical protein [Pedobacter nyackensis]|uniref:hypothetical protein n=1 Tax=Pedobacter nyackensis TaxID=475255 RepID=UPI000A02BFE3|nr:hypothetical protein [Pedobacter nyackensis]
MKSLIQLPKETTHYFSEEYWYALAEVAKQFNLPGAKYCLEQIERNKQELGSKIPFGWTMEKLDDTHFPTHIAAKIKKEWTTERREKDNVQNLLKQDGIYEKSYGRAGFLDSGRHH